MLQKTKRNCFKTIDKPTIQMLRTSRRFGRFYVVQVECLNRRFSLPSFWRPICLKNIQNEHLGKFSGFSN